ncbi:MAG TPA: hypothetical protein VJU86_15865 [Pyrinomonadaceae bacterium]|nr:hypothetical protein [Pyrinomonadaceae bacterium]
MKRLFSIFVFAILLCLPLVSVRANEKKLGFSSLIFGTKEIITRIQDIEGTDYKLSHKYTLHFFIAGTHLSDDGYVLQKRSEFSSYRNLTPEEIQRFQQAGVLPSPLPAYSIPLLAYLAGYSLWIILAIAIAIALRRPLMRRLRGQRNCPTCGLPLNARELQAKVCGACSTPFV